jgi:ferredoxin-nitrite reductase
VEREGVVGGGFHVFVGGGFQDKARIAVPVCREILAGEIPALVEEMLRTYLDRRTGTESFSEFTRRHADDELAALFASRVAEEAVA